jgi:hypothetical protein
LEKEPKYQRTLLCYFNKHVTENYLFDENIFFINDDIISIFINNRREEFNILNHEISDYTNNYITLIEELKFYSPIILRWNSLGDDFELNLRKAAHKIIQIADLLKKYKINKCLVSTGVYHHLDTLIIDLACRLINIPRIYFYINNITGRLIPIIQYGNITTRKSLNLDITNNNCKNDIINFKNRAINNASPLIGGQFLKTDILQYRKAIYSATYFYIKSIAINFFKLFISKKDSECSNFNYPFQYIKQVVNQKRALDFLNSNLSIVDVSNSHNLKLLILAHYQPEATSFPEGHKLWNHIDIAFKLRQLGYEHTIYYKEHLANRIYFTSFGPSQVGSYRDIGYYKSLTKLNCKFIKDTSTYKYGGANCEKFLPVTITGTVAVERALNGLHTIITGHPWYKGMPGVIHIDDIELINQLPKNYLTKNDQIADAALNFLNNMLTNKTVTNSFGIGIDGKFDKSKFNDFVSEINIIINAQL